MLLSHWALLGFVVWTMLLVVTTIGVPRLTAIATRRAASNAFNAAVPHGSERYQRSMRAHANCVENLPVFAALVLLGSWLQVSGSWFQVAAVVVLPARIVQSLAHIASNRAPAVWLRFVAFCVQLCGFAVLATLLVRHGLR
jgi:uncharacterized MAPEG superfamily protein